MTLLRLALIPILLLASSCARKPPRVIVPEKVAESSYQWTGVAVSRSGRIFVNYPTWDVPSPFKVAEIVNGQEVAYPSAEVNRQFVCVQSVFIDDKDRLWILDPASPRFGGVVEGGARLHLVNLTTNAIERTYTFDSATAPKDSYLNDVRIDTARGFAYITDSKLGGIIVLNLQSGESWRALEQKCQATQANLINLDFDSTGRWDNIVHSDGIEISPDRETLYFSALTGNILYRVPTATLRDPARSAAERCAAAVKENNLNVPADGLWLSEGKLYMANLPAEGLWVYDLTDRAGKTLDVSESIRWADSFAQDAKGAIYFTTSQINYPASQRTKYTIYRFTPFPVSR